MGKIIVLLPMKGTSERVPNKNMKDFNRKIAPDLAFCSLYGVSFVDKQDVLQQSDIVSVNVPLKANTYDYISTKELESMKPDAVLTNTASGKIVNENNFYEILKNGVIAGFAVDVFEEDSYRGTFLEEMERYFLKIYQSSKEALGGNTLALQNNSTASNLKLCFKCPLSPLIM